MRKNSTSDTPTEATEDSKVIEIPQVHTDFIQTKHDEDDSPENKSISEFEIPKENGEQNIGKDNKLLSTNYIVKMKTKKLKGS